jgi:hypothetical protein
MTVIKVPRPPQSAYDTSRPVSSLLKMQVEHLFEAEKRLPSRYRSEIYINAIKTEAEAANYIRAVTEAIHEAHADAERVRRSPKPKRGLEIAAVADERAERKRKSKGGKGGGDKISEQKTSGKKTKK